MMIHEITAQVGRHKRKKRLGRGISAGQGKTCGRGHKGAGSRSGWTGSIRASREGGQMPFFRRIGKRGFTNALFRRRYAIVNLQAIEDRFSDGAEVTVESLIQAGLVRDQKLPVKILGQGTVTKKLKIEVHAVSGSVQEKVEKAGGSVTVG